MLNVIFSALFTMIFAVGCGGPRYVDYFPFHDDGTPKPKIVLMPIVDSSESGLPWDVSNELSEGIYDDLMGTGELYVLSEDEKGAACDNVDMFSSDLTCMRDLANADFIVALELIEHTLVSIEEAGIEDTSIANCHSYNRVLMLRMRLRVIDIRRQAPRVVLYEVVKTGYVVTPSYYTVNYHNTPWGSKEFLETPCGTAHQRIVKKLSSRIESVIRSAR